MNIYEGFNAYKTYLSVRNHFNSNYDFFKYKGKLNVSQDSFLKRSDKYFFAKLERKYKGDQLVYFFVSNFIDSEDSWSGSLVTNQSEEVFLNWLKRIESLKYNFQKDCKYLLNEMEIKNYSFNDLYDCSNSHPVILKKYMGSFVTIETIVIFDKILGLFKKFDKLLNDDIVYQKISKKAIKYSPFVSINTDEYKALMKKIFLSS